MTGKYPARLHLTDWIPGRKQWPTAKLLTPSFEQQLPLPEVTIAEALKPEFKEYGKQIVRNAKAVVAQ